jgi:vitamin B12/bleomycin/antimicrobial peptide transport system ATP-binding/permease protein
MRARVRDLSLEVTTAVDLLIVGESGVGKTSVLRAIAGLWRSGSGRIVRLPLSDTIFLPQRPYMIAGSLRDQLCYPHAGAVAEEHLVAILRLVNLDCLPQRIGGFDAGMKWEDLLPLGEQQQIAFARLFNRPAYAFLDEATSALDASMEEALYRAVVTEAGNSPPTHLSVQLTSPRKTTVAQHSGTVAASPSVTHGKGPMKQPKFSEDQVSDG